MTRSGPPSPIRHADYEAIEAALLESARGRWFLAEYSRRNRSADTRMLLDAITRLEATRLRPRDRGGLEPLLDDLRDMHGRIAGVRGAIAAPAPAAAETAPLDMLGAAEAIQETAWRLRETGVDTAVCDRLDAQTAALCAACATQSDAPPATSDMIALLRDLEMRLELMIGVWGRDRPALQDAPVLPPGDGDDRLSSTLDDIDFVEISPGSQPSAPASGAATAAVPADRFTKPADLALTDLDETKTSALFA